MTRPTRSQRFAPREQCAIAPAAFGLLFELAEPEACEQRDGVAVVRVQGPLMRAGGWWFDSYEAITERVAAALETRPKAVMLAIDSPGGVVAGCFETARTLRAMAKMAGIPLVAFTDGQATSAAYALATAAERVIATPSSTLGSIGVIDALVDVTAMDEALGVRFEFVASGARKTDGQPHVKIAPEAKAAAQTRVDELAEQFFALVAEHRPVSAQAVKDLEAALVHGGQAVRLKLADELVETFDQAIASAATPEEERPMTAKASDYEDGVAKLRKAAEGDDEEAKKAQKMLAAMEDEEKSESDDDEEKKGDEDAKAEGDDEEKDDEDAKAVASTVVSLADRLQSLEAKAEAEEREKLLAAYPHVGEKMRAVVAKMPLAQAKVVLEATPKPKVPHPAAAATVVGTRGASQGDGSRADRQSPEAAAAMDRAMGLTPMKPGVVREPGRLVLGALVPAEPAKK